MSSLASSLEKIIICRLSRFENRNRRHGCDNRHSRGRGLVHLSNDGGNVVCFSGRHPRSVEASVAIDNRAEVEKRMVVDLNGCGRFWQGMFLGIEYLWGSAAREETLWGC